MPVPDVVEIAEFILRIKNKSRLPTAQPANADGLYNLFIQALIKLMATLIIVRQQPAFPMGKKPAWLNRPPRLRILRMC